MLRVLRPLRIISKNEGLKVSLLLSFIHNRFQLKLCSNRFLVSLT